MQFVDTDSLATHATETLRSSRSWKLGLFVCGILGLNLGGSWIATQLDLQIWPQHSDIIELFIVAIVIAFVVAMASPFVPGIEIGLALMLMLGPGGVVLVYLCTQMSLILSFILGRLVPPRFLARFFRWLQFEQASQLLEAIGNTPPDQRIQRLAQHSTSRWLSFVVRYRYLALAIALNLPGNAAIGGAGGIGMVAGMSRAYSFPGFAALIALSTLPVPVFLLVTGFA